MLQESNNTSVQLLWKNGKSKHLIGKKPGKLYAREKTHEMVAKDENHEQHAQFFLLLALHYQKLVYLNFAQTNDDL